MSRNTQIQRRALLADRARIPGQPRSGEQGGVAPRQPIFHAVADRQLLQAILVAGTFGTAHVIGAELELGAAAVAVFLPMFSLLMATRSDGDDRGAYWLSLSTTISIAITAAEIGPFADLQWLFFANVAVFFLAFEERHPRPQSVAVGLNVGCFAAFTLLQQTDHWHGALSVPAQHAISWGTRAVAIVDLLWIMRYFLHNERRYREAERRISDEGWRAAAAREAFFADMCHEIRTPLVAITHVHEVLLKAPRTEEERALVEQALAAGDHLVAILNDGLDLARMDAGRLDIDPRPFAVPELVDETVELWRAMAGARDLTVEGTCDLGDQPVRVGDRRRIKQVLYNLVNNAVKFTEHGAVRVVVARGEGDDVVFRVIDSGIGMTPDQLERVFGTFVQGDTTTGDRYGGSGLGLAISHRLASLFGGRLEAFSELNGGSEFRLTLPMAVADEAPQPNPTTQRGPVTGGLHILLAEDAVVNQWVMRRVLEDLGHRVEVASDGRAAVAAWRRTRPDLILMDVQMPLLDGISATRQIRDMEAPGSMEVPILALSGHAMQSEVQDCLDAGMNGHLAKPVHAEALQDAIEAAIRAPARVVKAPELLEIASAPR